MQAGGILKSLACNLVDDYIRRPGHGNFDLVDNSFFEQCVIIVFDSDQNFMGEGDDGSLYFNEKTLFFIDRAEEALSGMINKDVEALCRGDYADNNHECYLHYN